MPHRPIVLSSIRNSAASIAAVIVLGACKPASAQLSAYLNSPGDNTGAVYTSITHASLVSYGFDNIFTTLSAPVDLTSSLASPVGTFELSPTDTLGIIKNDAYSNKAFATSQAPGNYAAIGAESGNTTPVTLALPRQDSYFGLSWNAGDIYNQLWFYNGSTLVGYYSTAALVAILPKDSTTITTIGGTNYAASDYYGQQGSGYDSNEPFAFLNFIAKPGSTFNYVVFGNSNTTATGFEFDNPTIIADNVIPDNSFFDTGTSTTTSGAPNPYNTPGPLIIYTPEPGCMALLIGAGSVLFGFRRKARFSS